jgi:hypothetical protein
MTGTPVAASAPPTGATTFGTTGNTSSLFYFGNKV